MELQSQSSPAQLQMAPYAVPGLSLRSTLLPATTALPMKAERLMKLRRETRFSRNCDARSTTVTRVIPRHVPPGCGGLR